VTAPLRNHPVLSILPLAGTGFVWYTGRMTRVLFTLGWIDVPSFTALMALALGAGLWLTWNAARSMHLPPGDVLNAALVGLLVGVVAAARCTCPTIGAIFATIPTRWHNSGWADWRGTAA